MGLFGLLTGILGGLIGIVTTVLSPTQQNGNSLLGLLTAPILPFFLTNNPLPFGYPWGSLTANNANPYTSAPNTGVTRRYDFTVTRGVIAPDGVQKQVILINGQFPGPTIEANWGDMLMITVHNQISNPAEGIGMHWHGILQKKTQYYDGVASVTQCPIAPGSSFTYTFQADLYGTSWYHSHFSAQYAGGLIGPMIIYGPTHVPYDIDLGPVMLSDYYHTPYYDILEGTLNNQFDFSKIVPLSDNNLINGKMFFNCALAGSATCTPNAPVAKFQFKKGKVHRLRLINAGAEGIQRFSIDGHTMTVIANDFVPIVPYATQVVTLGIGQRADILVTGTGGLKSTYWMRSSISSICSLSLQPDALAAIYYDNADTTSTPSTLALPALLNDPGTCNNDDLTQTVPYYPIKPPAQSDFTQQLDINFAPNASNIFLWTMNNQTFRGNYNKPVLLQANQGNTTFPAESNVYSTGNNKSITYVINNPAGLPAHPMHMHGHNFWVLHVGPGAWDGTVTNPQNPQRRDTQLLPGGSHLVLQINTDNPGAWPLHCHIAWHVSSGLYVTILEQPSLVKQINIPATSQQLCNDWSSWTKTNVPDQIDSGL